VAGEAAGRFGLRVSHSRACMGASRRYVKRPRGLSSGTPALGATALCLLGRHDPCPVGVDAPRSFQADSLGIRCQPGPAR
jgi:hypothetical protein